MATESVHVSATSNEMIFAGNMYKAPPLDKKRRKVGFPLPLSLESVLYIHYVNTLNIMCIFFTISTEMARTLLHTESKPYARMLQVTQSSWIKQVSEENHWSSWMYQSWDWSRVQKLRTHPQFGHLQKNILPRCTQWPSYASVGKCVGKNEECTGW